MDEWNFIQKINIFIQFLVKYKILLKKSNNPRKKIDENMSLNKEFCKRLRTT